MTSYNSYKACNMILFSEMIYEVDYDDQKDYILFNF